MNPRQDATNRLFVSVVIHALLAAWALVIAGCNTMEGAGKDIKKGGQKIEDKATENK